MKPTGYSGTPLWKKLGFKDGYATRVINAPDHYAELLEGRPSNVHFNESIDPPKDLIHFFTKQAKELFELLPELKNEIKQDSMIWVSWPKKVSKVSTDITEDVIREAAFKNGLVDIKVCAVDQVWSGLKLVIPVKERK